MAEKKTTVELLLPSNLILNSNQRKHYYTKAEDTKIIRRLAKIEPSIENAHFEKCQILVFVAPPTRRRCDPANYYPTVKAIVDGLTDRGFWDDDDYKHVEEIAFRYGGTSGKKDYYKFTLEITGE